MPIDLWGLVTVILIGGALALTGCTSTDDSIAMDFYAQDADGIVVGESDTGIQVTESFRDEPLFSVRTRDLAAVDLLEHGGGVAIELSEGKAQELQELVTLENDYLYSVVFRVQVEEETDWGRVFFGVSARIPETTYLWITIGESTTLVRCMSARIPGAYDICSGLLYAFEES